MRLVPGSAVHFPRDSESHQILLLRFSILSADIVAFLEAW